MFLDTGMSAVRSDQARQGDVDLAHQQITVTGRATGPHNAIRQQDRLGNRQVPAPTSTASGLSGSARISQLWIGRQGRMSTSGVSDALHRLGASRSTPAALAPVAPHLRPRLAAEDGNEGDLIGIGGWRSRAMLDRYGKSAKVERARGPHKRLWLGDRV